MEMVGGIVPTACEMAIDIKRSIEVDNMTDRNSADEVTTIQFSINVEVNDDAGGWVAVPPMTFALTVCMVRRMTTQQLAQFLARKITAALAGPGVIDRGNSAA